MVGRVLGNIFYRNDRNILFYSNKKTTESAVFQKAITESSSTTSSSFHVSTKQITVHNLSSPAKNGYLLVFGGSEQNTCKTHDASKPPHKKTAKCTDFVEYLKTQEDILQEIYIKIQGARHEWKPKESGVEPGAMLLIHYDTKESWTHATDEQWQGRLEVYNQFLENKSETRLELDAFKTLIREMKDGQFAWFLGGLKQYANNNQLELRLQLEDRYFFKSRPAVVSKILIPKIFRKSQKEYKVVVDKVNPDHRPDTFVKKVVKWYKGFTRDFEVLSGHFGVSLGVSCARSSNQEMMGEKAGNDVMEITAKYAEASFFLQRVKEKGALPDLHNYQTEGLEEKLEKTENKFKKLSKYLYVDKIQELEDLCKSYKKGIHKKQQDFKKLQIGCYTVEEYCLIFSKDQIEKEWGKEWADLMQKHVGFSKKPLGLGHFRQQKLDLCAMVSKGTVLSLVPHGQKGPHGEAVKTLEGQFIDIGKNSKGTVMGLLQQGGVRQNGVFYPFDSTALALQDALTYVTGNYDAIGSKGGNMMLCCTMENGQPKAIFCPIDPGHAGSKKLNLKEFSNVGTLQSQDTGSNGFKNCTLFQDTQLLHRVLVHKMLTSDDYKEFLREEYDENIKKLEEFKDKGVDQEELHAMVDVARKFQTSVLARIEDVKSKTKKYYSLDPKDIYCIDYLTKMTDEVAVEIPGKQENVKTRYVFSLENHGFWTINETTRNSENIQFVFQANSKKDRDKALKNLQGVQHQGTIKKTGETTFTLELSQDTYQELRESLSENTLDHKIREAKKLPASEASQQTDSTRLSSDSRRSIEGK